MKRHETILNRLDELERVLEAADREVEDVKHRLKRIEERLGLLDDIRAALNQMALGGPSPSDTEVAATPSESGEAPTAAGGQPEQSERQPDPGMPASRTAVRDHYAAWTRGKQAPPPSGWSISPMRLTKTSESRHGAVEAFFEDCEQVDQFIRYRRDGQDWALAFPHPAAMPDPKYLRLLFPQVNRRRLESRTQFPALEPARIERRQGRWFGPVAG